MATETEWAWLAGLYEGEGSLTFTGRSSCALTIGMTDQDVVLRARSVAGGCGNMHTQARDGAKTMHVWRVTTAADVRALVQALRPWLGERRGARVDAALVRLEAVRRPGHCKRDHPLTGENLYESPGGQQHCRACMRIRDAARKKRS